MNIGANEKIATIAECHFLRGSSDGSFGKAIDISQDTSWQARIEVRDGPCVLVRRNARGQWEVSFKGFVGTDADIEFAARLALDAGKDVSATQNYRI